MRSAIFVLCLSGHCFSIGWTAQDSPSASEVMVRSREAMLPPISYVMRRGATEFSVAERMIGDSRAIRMESDTPVPKVLLILGEESYEIFPKANIVIDTGFQQGLLLAQVTKIRGRLDKNDTRPENLSLDKSEIRNGELCYVVVQDWEGFVSDVVKQIKPDAGGRRNIPVKRHTYVSASTFELRAVETFSGDGGLLHLTEYENVERAAPLEQVFLPPNDLEVLKPASMIEYIKCTGKAIGASFKAAPDDTETSKLYRATLEKMKADFATKVSQHASGNPLRKKNSLEIPKLDRTTDPPVPTVAWSSQNWLTPVILLSLVLFVSGIWYATKRL